MDNLVLASVAWDLAAAWTGSLLEDLRHESDARFRLRFALPRGGGSIVVSLRPEAPWVGRPSRRWEGPRWNPDPFVPLASRALVGRKLVRIEKAAADRALSFVFLEDRALVVELAPHGANLVLLGEGRVDACLRRTRSTATRLAAGAAYAPPPMSPAGIDPFDVTASALDAYVEERRRNDEPMLEILRRGLRGVGTVGASLVLEEAATSGESVGTVLRRRLDEILAGDARPRLQAPEPPWEAVAHGRFAEPGFRLLPWVPVGREADADLLDGGGAAATAGLYYECRDAAEHQRARLLSLGGILRAESSRAHDGERRARENSRAFELAADHGRHAEAILAGLSRAVRSGDRVIVPDPYDPDGALLSVPAPPGVPLARVAEDLYRKQRRARRGAEAARARAEALRGRLDALDAIAVRHEGARSESDAAEIESALRSLGVAVGLARSPRVARALAAATRPRLAGVRVLTSVDGFTILVGQTGRDNDRLTFKIAAPEDVWLHASGVPGAHVVIRASERGSAPPETTLREAAALAAWFSDARGNATVDVQWTRRKNVRRARGAAPGTVLVKRFEVVRVSPRPIDPRQGVT